MDADVIIIGSGPAGGMSACTLAGSMRVLLIERYKLPREKLCSGVVTPKTAVQLAGVIDLQSVLIGESHRFWMGLRGRGKEFEHDPPLLFASRPRMDLALVEAAAARGADVIEGAAVASVDPEAGTVTLRDGRRLAARVVIGADGAAGVARRAVDPAPAVRGFAMEVRIPDPRGAGDRPSIADFGVPHGFLWAYPKRDGTLAIGGGTAHRSMPELPDIVRAFARQRFGVSLPDRIPGHLIPFRPARRVKRGKVLLAGDAAGLVDPIIGEGIPYALWSGRLAAESTMRHIYAGESLDQYNERLRREIGGFTRWLHVFGRLAPVLPLPFLAAMRFDVTNRALWAYLGGRVPLMPTGCVNTSAHRRSVAL